MRERLVQIIIGFMVAVFLVGSVGVVGLVESTYLRDGYVSEILVDDDCIEVVVVDYATENEWLFMADYNADFEINDNVTMLMLNNHTDSYIYDDEIFEVFSKK